MAGFDSNKLNDLTHTTQKYMFARAVQDLNLDPVAARGNLQPLETVPRRYVNRLSDLLFVLARVLNRSGGGEDVLWERERSVK